MLLAMLCGATAGCATNSDVCAVAYFKPSPRDTEKTQAQALAQNEFLKAQGCPERFSPIVGGQEAPARPSGPADYFRALIPN